MPPPSPRVLSVNIGRPVLQRVPRGRPTGIGKQPVDAIRVSDPGPKRIVGGPGVSGAGVSGAGVSGVGVSGAGVSGVEGDHVGDGRHHGGSDQAVYAFAREELDVWERELGRKLLPGMFGENLTTLGLDVDAAEVGDIWRVGTAVLEVRGPRVPCATFAERMGEKGWVKRFAAHGRSGAYLQVNEPGEIRPGDPITVNPSGSGLTVPTYLRAWFGDRDAARAVLESGALTGDRRAELEQITSRA